MNISLSGRIDANSAPDIEAAISQELAKCPGEAPVFDASGLEYISSAGLRVLLKFRKQFGKNLDVLNVSNTVYDIFEVTGFNELLNVKKALREISLEGCEVIGGGAFSTVYRLDPETIVKVFTHPTATLASAEADRETSREVFVHDIPTAIAYDVVKAGGHYGLVYEMINADTASSILSKHPERLEELSIKIAHLLKKLHTTEFEPGTFADARNRPHARVQAAFDANVISADDKEIVDGIIDRIPYRNTFIHSDFHTKNLMVSGDELILIDVGDAGLGNPINDFLVSYTHFVEFGASMPPQAKAHHEQILGLSHKMLAEVWKIVMREYFGTSDEATLKHNSDIMRIYASIMMCAICSSVARHVSLEAGRELAVKYVSRLREAAGTLKPIDGI